jgi:hypothetical protein
MKKKRVLLTTLVSAALLASPAVAEQAGTGHYISGMFADFSGYPPTQSGWTFANYFLNYHDATAGGSKELPLGAFAAVGVTANTYADIPIALYSYPFDFLGGTVSSGVGIPFVWMRVKAEATIDRRRGSNDLGLEQTASGLGDIVLLPVMAGWTNGDFHFGGMFNTYAPSGSYSRDNLANTGLGYWTFEPMLTLGWLSTKIGTELSIFTAVDFNTENTQADYQSGDIFHVDATLAQHLPLAGGIIGVGATAFYLRQITGDSGSGARLGSFEAESYGVGPTISYVHPIGKSTLVVDASWLPQLHNQNTTKGDFIWVKIGLAF